MEKVGHQAKLRQALRVITKTTNSTQSTSKDVDVNTTNNNSIPLTPSTMTVDFLPSPTTTTHTSSTL